MFYTENVSTISHVDRFDSHDVPDATLVARLLDRVLEDQFAVNRRSAARAETLAELLTFARTHPHVYAFTEDADAGAIAERALLRDAALRSGVPENTIRSMAATAEAAGTRLPRLWRRALDGFAAFPQVEMAVSLLAIIGEGVEVIAEFDTELADAVVRLGSTGFRAFTRRLARRLSQIPPAIRHRDTVARRRVIVEPAEDGMAWLSAYLPLTEAVAVKRRLTSTAKHVSKAERRGRTRDQIRADLLSSWLRGEGTATAVRTKVVVTVPVSMLAGAARATVRKGRLRCEGPDLNAEPLVDGTTPIDANTAVAAIVRSGAFTRVFTDPISGVILDMDRRSRKATPAQVEWLTLAYSTCAVEGCEHPAADADIDHWLEFHGPHRGPTNLANLHPLCGNDHKLASRSKLTFERAADGVVRVHSPAVTPVSDPLDDRVGGSTEHAEQSRCMTSVLARMERPAYGEQPPF